MACKIQRSWDSNFYRSSSEVQAVFATLRLALPLVSPKRSGRENIYYKTSFFPFSVANPSMSHYLLCWDINSIQQARRTNSRSRSIGPENRKLLLLPTRNGGRAPVPQATNLGWGPERLQTAPRSQVLVKAHVPARRGEQKRLSFPGTLAAAGAHSRLESQ